MKQCVIPPRENKYKYTLVTYLKQAVFYAVCNVFYTFLSLATASKGTSHKTGIASNILDAISQGSESQRVLEKCIAYSPPFEDYAQVKHAQAVIGKVARLYLMPLSVEI